MDNKPPHSQVVRGAEQFNDAKLREIIRFYVPSAIKRLVELCNSNNESVALGANKVLLSKCIPDMKAIEISGDDKQPLLVVNLDAIKGFAQRADKLPTETK